LTGDENGVLYFLSANYREKENPMDGQRRLVITLAVEVNVPPSGLEFNSLVAAFHRFGEVSTARLFEVTLEALEKRLGERMMAEQPGRFVWNGFQGSQAKSWILPFGEVRHRYRRLRDRHSGKHLVPLREGLAIPLRKRFTWATLIGPVGLASELSFRRAAREGRRLQGDIGPSKSTTWDYFQSLADSGLDPFLPPSQRTMEVVLADATKLKQQARGRNQEPMDLRVVLSERRNGGDLQVAAFDLEAEWPVLKRRLERACPGQTVGVLLTDGELGTEALADQWTRVQRCLFHGPRGLRFALYQDGLKKRHQDPILHKLLSAEAWCTNAEALAALPQRSRYHLRGLLDRAKYVCEEILQELPAGAEHARSYLSRFVHDGLAFLRALLNGEPPLPGVTTNQLENIFSQMDLRLKEIGRRWSFHGATRMVRILLTKIFRPELWNEHLAALRGLPGAVTIEARILDHGWVS
jgi:hypothetical protein